MKIKKINKYQLEKCYAISPLEYKKKDYMLVAAEKVNKCLMFDLDGNLEETIWEEPGGTMSMVQVPGKDGVFLSIQKFYSPNDSKEARIVAVTPKEKNNWEIKVLVELPFVHRFDILSRNGVNYIIACTLKSGHEYKDDWRTPGKIWAGILPEDFRGFGEGTQLQMTVIKDGLMRNHGYCRVEEDGAVWAAVSSESGIFKVAPPLEKGGEWIVESITEDGASDITFGDYDGDGEKEMMVITPFHGDTIKVYKKVEGRYVDIYTYPDKYEFSHGIYSGRIGKKDMAIIGHRKGARDLLAFFYDGEKYVSEYIDRDVGPANVRIYEKDGRTRLIATNREIDEIAFYEVEEA